MCNVHKKHFNLQRTYAIITMKRGADKPRADKMTGIRKELAV